MRPHFIPECAQGIIDRQCGEVRMETQGQDVHRLGKQGVPLTCN